MLLFHTDNLPHYGLDRIFKFTKEAGFDGIEIGITPMLDTQNPQYIKELSKRYDLSVVAFSLSDKYDQGLRKAFQNTVREFPKSTINLNPAPAMDHLYKKWLKQTIPKLVSKYHLISTKRNMIQSTYWGIFPKRENNTFLQLKKTPRICLDISALVHSHEDLMRSTSMILNKIYHVYLSNSTKRSTYTPPDKGFIPVESFLKKLAKNGYEGDICIKVRAKFYHEGDDKKVLENMINMRGFYEKYFIKEKTI